MATEPNSHTVYSSGEIPKGRSDNGYLSTTPTRRKQGPVKKTLLEFCEETTAHGPGHVVQAKMPWIQWFWIVVFIAAIGGTSFHLYFIVNKYLSYPSQEVTKITQVSPQFPYVTICNQNPISTTNFQRMLSKSDANTTWFKRTVDQLKPLFQSDTITGTPNHIDDMFASPSNYFENIGLEETKAIGHEFKQFILDCTYGGRPCTEGDFELFIHPLYFNCYIFTGKQVRSHHSAVAEGPFNGLSLILYLETSSNPSTSYYNRYSPVGNSNGARIQVHTAGTYPRPDVHGSDVVTGHSSSVSLSVQETDKLQDPYGNCVVRYASAIGHRQYNYSSTLCFALCAQSHIHNTCGCSMASLPFYGESQPTCGSYHQAEGNGNSARLQAYINKIKCQNDAWHAFHSDEKLSAKCNCDPSCHQTQYETTISESTWPSSQYMDDFFTEFVMSQSSLIAYQKLNGIFATSSSTALQEKAMKENFVCVNIYFSNLEVVTQTELASYSLEQLFCDIGGTLGLWAGVSILNCLEVVGLFGKLLVVSCNKHKRKDDGTVVCAHETEEKK